MIDKRVHLLELFFRVVFQQMIIVFAHLDHFHHMVVQRRRLKLTVGFFTQVEDRQTCGEILIIRRITGDQVCGSLDNSFVDVRGLDTVIKLNVGAQLDLGNRNVMQSFCRPIQNAMDFVEIDALCATVALCHQQILIHVCRTCFSIASCRLPVVREAAKNTIYRGYVWDSLQDSVKLALLQVHNFVDNSGRKKWLPRTLGQTRCPGKSMGREKFVKNNRSVNS